MLSNDVGIDRPEDSFEQGIIVEPYRGPMVEATPLIATEVTPSTARTDLVNLYLSTVDSAYEVEQLSLWSLRIPLFMWMSIAVSVGLSSFTVLRMVLIFSIFIASFIAVPWSVIDGLVSLVKIRQSPRRAYVLGNVLGGLVLNMPFLFFLALWLYRLVIH